MGPQVKFKNSDDWKRAKTMKSKPQTLSGERSFQCVCVCGNRRDGRSGGENERVGESFIHKGEKAGAHSVMNNIFIAVTLSAAGGFNFSAVCVLDVCPARFTSGKRM